jgi:hypothetical protein
MMLSWQLTLIKSYQAISHVSSLETINASGTISVPIIRQYVTMCWTIPHIHIPRQCSWFWVRANGKLVGGVKCLLSLALLLDWCISILLHYVCHQVPRLTECEATIPVKVAGVKLDLNNLLYHTVHISCCFIQDGECVEIDVVFFSNLCSTTVDILAGPDIHVSYIPYIWFPWICQSAQHRLYHTHKANSDFYTQVVFYRS